MDRANKQAAAQSANQYALMMAQQMETDKPIVRAEPTPMSTEDIVKRINDKFNATSSTERQRPNTRKIPQARGATRWGRPKANPIQKAPKSQQMSGLATAVQVKAQATNAYALELARKAEEEAKKAAEEAEILGRRVTVGNLPPNYNIENLYVVFENRAGVRPTGISPTTPGCCMVTFGTGEESKQAAAKVNGLQVIDRNLLVTLAGDTPQKDTEDIIARINARFKKLHDPNKVFEEPTPPPPPPAPAPPPPPPAPTEKKKGVDKRKLRLEQKYGHAAIIDNSQPPKKLRPDEGFQPGFYGAAEQGFAPAMHPPTGQPYGQRMPIGQRPPIRAGMPPGSMPPAGTQPRPMPPHVISRHAMPPQPMGPRGMPPRPAPPLGMPPRGPPPRAPPPGAPPLRGMPPRGPSPQGMPPRGPSPQGMPPRGPSPQGMPPRGPSPQGMPPRGPSPQGMPPRGPSPQGMPPRGPSPQGMPPRGHSPQGMPPRGPSPQGMPPQGAGPSGTMSSSVPDDQKALEVDYLIKMLNVPRKATTIDIRVFFKGLSIPPCGVEIIGGEDEVGYIRMKYHDDLLRASAMSGGYMMGQVVKTLLVTSHEMETEKVAIMKQKQLRIEKLKRLKELEAQKSAEPKKPLPKFTMTWRETHEKEKVLPNTAIILKAKPLVSKTAQYIRSIMKDTSKQKIGNDLFNALKKAQQSGSRPADGASFTSLFDDLRQAGVPTGGSPGGSSPGGQGPKDDSGSDMEWEELSDGSDIEEGTAAQVAAGAGESLPPAAGQPAARRRKHADRGQREDGFYILVRHFDPELDEHDLMDYFIKRSVQVRSVIFKRMGDSSSAFVSFAIRDDRPFVLSMNGRQIGELDVEIIEVTKGRFKKAIATYDTPSEQPTHHEDQRESQRAAPMNIQPIKEEPVDNEGETEPSFMSLFDGLRQAGIQSGDSPSNTGPRDNTDRPVQSGSDAESSFTSLFDSLKQAGIQTDNTPRNKDRRDAPSTRQNTHKRRGQSGSESGAPQDASFTSLFDGLREAGINPGLQDDMKTPGQSESGPHQGSSFMSLFDDLKQAGIETGNSPSNDDPIASETHHHSERDSEAPQGGSFLSLFDDLREAGISTGDSPSNNESRHGAKSGTSDRSESAVHLAPWTKKAQTTVDQPRYSGRAANDPKDAPWTKQNQAMKDSPNQSDLPSDNAPKDAPWTKTNPTKPDRPAQSSGGAEPSGSFLSLFDDLRQAGIATGDSVSDDTPKDAPWTRRPPMTDGAPTQGGRSSPRGGDPKDAPWTRQNPTNKPKQRDFPSDDAPKDAPWAKKSANTDDPTEQSGSSMPRSGDPKDAPWIRQKTAKPKESQSEPEPSFMSLFDSLREAGIRTGDDVPNDAPWTRQNPSTDDMPRGSGSASPQNDAPKDAPWTKTNQTKQSSGEAEPSGSFLSLFDDLRQAGIPTGDSVSDDTPKDAPWSKKSATADDALKQSGSASPRSGDPKDAPWIRQNLTKQDRLTRSGNDTEPSFLSLFDSLRQAGIQTDGAAGNTDPKDAPWTKDKPARWSPEPPEASS